MTKPRTYTKEFKNEAVELADEIGNCAQVERDFGTETPHLQNGRDYNSENSPFQFLRPPGTAILAFGH